MIKLGRLWIKNFKSFLNETLFDLSGKDIVIFDGPNGFGKTTVFDAIELCFTKKVGRVFHTDNKQKESHFLKNDSNQDTFIFLELLENDRTKAVIFVKIPANTSKTENKTNSYFVEHKLLKEWPTDFYDQPFDESESNLACITNNDQLYSTFSLFNYVQQEETCHFLKQKEAVRHNQISYLFGTNEETTERDNFKLIETKINEKIKSVTGENNEKLSLKKEIELNYSKLFERFDGVENIEATGLISKIVGLINISKEQLTIYKNHLDNLNWLLTNGDVFLKQKFNYQIDTMAQQRDQQLKDLILVGNTRSFSDIRKLDKHVKWINSLENKLKVYRKIKNGFELAPKEVSIDKLRFLGNAFPKVLEANNDKLNEYNLLISELGAYEKILNSIKSSRENLKSHYEEHIHQTNRSIDVECPLCGDIKVSNKQLWQEYNNQSDKFESLLSESSIKLKAIEEYLLVHFISPIVSRSQYFINKYESFINLKNILSNRQVSLDRWEKMQLVKKWLDTNKVIYKDLINNSILQEHENYTQQNVSLLKSRIRDLSQPVIADYDYAGIKTSLHFYNLHYSEKGLSQIDGVEIKSKDILHDIDFISYLEFRSQSDELNSAISAIDKNNRLLIALNHKLKEIKSIISSYTRQIKKYESSVAQQIAIPFYIYSSKILQTRPDGNGIFLTTAKTTKENGYIRFVSDLNEDHDAWNTMSSGQLSGLIISFMLAMNKVYPTRLATLLIDDPVQTMDEINMASFVQLLRYEFPDVQIVLSTHERKVANYFTYKYLESGLELDAINMKNIRLNS